MKQVISNVCALGIDQIIHKKDQKIGKIQKRKKNEVKINTDHALKES